MTNQTWSPSKACADFVADLQYADIPAAVIDTMKRDTLDWIGCAVGGAADRSSQPIKAVADVLGGNSQATSIDCGRRNVVLAAMSNAYFGHILEMDDVDRDSISHPATPNLAAAFAAAEFARQTGQRRTARSPYAVLKSCSASVPPSRLLTTKSFIRQRPRASSAPRWLPANCSISMPFSSTGH